MTRSEALYRDALRTVRQRIILDWSKRSLIDTIDAALASSKPIDPRETERVHITEKAS